MHFSVLPTPKVAIMKLQGSILAVWGLMAVCSCLRTQAFSGPRLVERRPGRRPVPLLVATTQASDSSVKGKCSDSSTTMLHLIRGDGSGRLPQRSSSAQNYAPDAMTTRVAMPTAPTTIQSIWDTSLSKVMVEGGALRTWSFAHNAIPRVQVLCKTESARDPLHVEIELWQGPDNAPQRVRVYSDNGVMRPFSAILETPRCHNAIAMRNCVHTLQYPLSAIVDADAGEVEFNNIDGLGSVAQVLDRKGVPSVLSCNTGLAGRMHDTKVDDAVSSMQVLLKSMDGRPMHAAIELLQNDEQKQVLEVYAEDGYERPFFCVLETPGDNNVVRIHNTSPYEFSLMATVQPYEREDGGLAVKFKHDADGLVMDTTATPII